MEGVRQLGATCERIDGDIQSKVLAMDLNADVGETTIERDRRLMPWLSSCNVCCGAHAGCAELIVATIREARRCHVRIGAHPSYPDRASFGRVTMSLSDSQLEAELLFQIATVKSLVEILGGTLQHVKPHGALYHDVCLSDRAAAILIRVVRQVAPDAAIVGQAGSEFGLRVEQQGLSFQHEAFADRRYASAVELVPRTADEAVIENADQFRKHLGLLLSGKVQDQTGVQHTIPIDTICLHGDSANARFFAEVARSMIDDRQQASPTDKEAS